MKKIQLILILVGAFSATLQSCSKDEVKGCVDAEACNFNAEAQVDNGSCLYATVWYQDLDGNGFGNPYSSITDCNQPHGYVKAECDPITYYQDLDGDGLGNPSITTINCFTAADSAIWNGNGYVTNADDLIDALPDSVQRAIFTYIGASWNPECGSFGNAAKTYIEDTYGSSAILLNVQGNVDVGDSAHIGHILAAEFGPIFGNQFQSIPVPGDTTLPHIFMKTAGTAFLHQKFTNSAANNNIVIDNVMDAVANSFLQVKIVANTSRSGDSIIVNTAVEFVGAQNEHFIGVYLLEDNMDALQASSGLAPSIFRQNNVVRTAADLSNPLGVSSITGVLGVGLGYTNGERVEDRHAISISAMNDISLNPMAQVNLSNLKVAVVVYKTNSADDFSNAIMLNVD